MQHLTAVMKIYKYTPYNEQAIENVKNHELWFSSEFEDDPKDNNLPIGDFNDDKFLESSIELFKQYPEIYEKFEKIFQDNQISIDSNQAFSVKDMMKTLKATYHGLTCFTTNESNQYMWKKFAKNHSGLCLCFETDFDKDFFKELYPVVYEKKLSMIDLMDKDLPSQMKKYTTTKRIKFKPEDEIRLFKHKSGLHKYKSESLIEISMGRFFKDCKNLENMITTFYNHEILIK